MEGNIAPFGSSLGPFAKELQQYHEGLWWPGALEYLKKEC